MHLKKRKGKNKRNKNETAKDYVMDDHVTDKLLRSGRRCNNKINTLITSFAEYAL